MSLADLFKKFGIEAGGCIDCAERQEKIRKMVASIRKNGVVQDMRRRFQITPLPRHPLPPRKKP